MMIRVQGDGAAGEQELWMQWRRGIGRWCPHFQRDVLCESSTLPGPTAHLAAIGYGVPAKQIVYSLGQVRSSLGACDRAAHRYVHFPPVLQGPHLAIPQAAALPIPISLKC